jgi:hypothetical protein
MKMDIINLIAKASQHIIMCRPSDMEPQGFGSGCIIQYKGRRFLLSVAHVTDVDGLATCIETGLPATDLQTPLYSVGSMCYFDTYTVPQNIKELEIKKFEDLDINFDETLDITFCELKEEFPILQPEWDFGAYKIDRGPKVYLNFDDAGLPDRDKLHGLCGRVRHDFQGIRMISKPTLKLDLEFVGTYGRFHLFKTPEEISDADDYRGCSGAPILDETGKLVGLAQSVIEGSNSIFAFSIDECKKLLDLAIETELV